MGYLSRPETSRLFLPSNPTDDPEAYWVDMKKRAVYGDNRAAQSAMLQISAAPPNGVPPGSNGNAPEMVTDVEVGAFMGTLAVRLIVDWNLTDFEENPLPINLENLDRLDPVDGDFLAAEAQKRIGGRPPEKQAPFPKPSGTPSTGTRSGTKK